MQAEINAPTSKPKNRSWLLLFKPWLIALFIPLLIAGAGGAYYGYHYQWKDIYVKHPGAFQYMSDADADRSCWESAGQIGLLFGLPAGILGLGGYGCFVLGRRAVKKKRVSA
ncbi:MAG TPA: hypothetical protein V6D17_10095 [Candidatus Obscuribacterales bacterium]